MTHGDQYMNGADPASACPAAGAGRRAGPGADDRIADVVRTRRPRFVDTSNAALAVDCPRCGLVTPRFLPYCRNCGFALWPSRMVAGAAFEAWLRADPARAGARPYDIELPPPAPANDVDYAERAHRLGIHIFPSSSYPFVICVGFLFLGLAAVPFATPVRIALGAVGLVVFLAGVVGWVVLEDDRMYAEQALMTHEGAPTHADGSEVSGQPAEEQHH